MKCPPFLRLSLSLLLISTALAAPGKPITVEDLWAVKRVGAPSLAPDGRRAVVDLTSFDLKENSSSSDLWILDTQGGAPRQLTQHPAREGEPRWSPDGRWIAFAAQREGDEAAQIYVISPDGGEARRLTDLATGTSALRWFPSSQRIAFISWVWPDLKTAEENAQRLQERAEAKVKALVIEGLGYRYWDHWLADGRVAQIHAVEVESGTTTNLMAGSPLSVWRYDLSPGLSADFYDLAPDEQELAFVADSSPTPGLKANADLFTWSLVDGTVTNLTIDHPAADTHPRYARSTPNG